jgi:hypothetical protein
MGFWNKLFGKKNTSESAWDEVANSRDTINMNDPYLREQYVISCLEQMKDASDEIDRINDEYATVTSYLTDMEEIEALPAEDKADLEKIARNIHDLRKYHEKYVQTPSLMTDKEYDKMEAIASEAQEGIEKLTREEDYKAKVKSDLARIDTERTAYDMRHREVSRDLENSRGVAVIAMVAAAVLVVILFMLQVFLKLDVAIGYYITVGITAVAITLIYIKYTDFVREKKKIESTANSLILLENKVKIRYVNNKNLLDYLYTKYQVSSAAELKDLYTRYLKERENRRSFEKNEAAYETETAKLLRRLRAMRIKDPDVWVHQSDAIYDNREMVEVRHNLIGRRQKLRKQLEYNQEIASEARDELKDVIRRYPEAADSLMETVNKYGQH